MVRVMREDISGIRVVRRCPKPNMKGGASAESNEAMTRADIKASTIMAIPVR